MPMTSSNSKNILDFLSKIAEKIPNGFFRQTKIRTTSEDLQSQIGCGKGEKASLVGNPKIEKKEKKDRYKTRRQMLPCKYEMLQENIKDETLRYGINKMGQQVGIIAVKDEQGINHAFTTNTKGTKRYNFNYGQQIEDEITFYRDLGWETFGLTLTCNPTLYDNTPYTAWNCFKADNNELFRYIREKLGGVIILVMESTKKGYPHAHLFIAFPKGTIPNYAKLPKRKSLKYGFLPKQIKMRIKSPIFNLQKVAGKKLQNYMSKYLKKMAEVDTFRLPEKKEELTDAERKVAICLIATTITNTRQFVLPTQAKKKKILQQHKEKIASGEIKETMSQDEEEQIEQQLANAKTKEGWQLDFARLRAYLIKLCNNFPCSNKKDVYLMKNADFNARFKVPLEEMKHPTEEQFNIFKKCGTELTCGGCLLYHLRRFVLNEGKSWFDNAYFFDGNEFRLIFTEEVKNDDKQFIISLAWTVEYILSNIQLFTCSIRTFFESKYVQELFFVKTLANHFFKIDFGKPFPEECGIDAMCYYLRQKGFNISVAAEEKN